KQLREKITAAIDRLPDNARETLLLREVEGLSYAEIGKALSIPKGTVMSRLHYARKQLQTMLVEAGVGPAAATEVES
nr:sigma-70 family RNA polymerase sigma factor [Myxococcota bacterium]